MNSNSLLLSLAILSSSFWGSWHCAGMCGPVASLMAHKKNLWSYHLGRAISYVLMGALGGYLGSFFLQSDFIYIRIISGIMFALILIMMGVNMIWFKKIFTLPGFSVLTKRFSAQTPGSLLGLMSVFLPCGWLYTYVLASMATQNYFSGMWVMFLFWLGGLPALSALSLFMKKAILVSHTKKQRMAGVILVVAGLYSLMSFYFI